MRGVLIACTQTLDLVATGFEADSLDELEDENMLFACPSCDADHPWTPMDAVLADAVSA